MRAKYPAKQDYITEKEFRQRYGSLPYVPGGSKPEDVPEPRYSPRKEEEKLFGIKASGYHEWGKPFLPDQSITDKIAKMLGFGDKKEEPRKDRKRRAKEESKKKAPEPRPFIPAPTPPPKQKRITESETGEIWAYVRGDRFSMDMILPAGLKKPPEFVTFPDDAAKYSCGYFATAGTLMFKELPDQTKRTFKLVKWNDAGRIREATYRPA